MNVTLTDAEQLALNFLMDEWKIPPEDQEWFTIVRSRSNQTGWYVVEIGVEGLPDRWFLQVYDTGTCDPSYTFHSPIQSMDGTTDSADLPESVAEALASERTMNG